jgi:hypothetical protein
MLGHAQQRIEQLQIRQTYIATLHWQTGFDPCVLRFVDLHLSKT